MWPSFPPNFQVEVGREGRGGSRGTERRKEACDSLIKRETTGLGLRTLSTKRVGEMCHSWFLIQMPLFVLGEGVFKDLVWLVSDFVFVLYSGEAPPK